MQHWTFSFARFRSRVIDPLTRPSRPVPNGQRTLDEESERRGFTQTGLGMISVVFSSHPELLCHGF